MSAPAANLNPPLDTPYTPEELAKYNGVPEGQKIFVAIKGTIFDVSAKPDMYGPGKGYSVFAGKDGSKGLGLSSLKPEVNLSSSACRQDPTIRARSHSVTDCHFTFSFLPFSTSFLPCHMPSLCAFSSAMSRTPSPTTRALLKKT